MKIVNTLYERLNTDQPFEIKYPEMELKDHKIHILYVAPCFNATGYYRMIAPAIELNRTKDYRAILSTIHNYNFTKRFGDYESYVDEELLEWADYIVFPPGFKPLDEIIDSINAINPALQLVMDIDSYYHNIPPEHPGQFSPKELDVLLRNMSRMNHLSFSTPRLLEAYQSHLKELIPEKFNFFSLYLQ